MSDWSKHAARKFLAQESAAREQTEKEREAKIAEDKRFVIEQGILANRAPELWLGLCQQIETACKEFNSDTGRQLLTCQKMILNTIEIVRSDTGMKTILTFESKTYSIKIRGLATDSAGEVEKLEIKIKPGTDEPAFFDNMSRLANPVNVAQVLVEQLIS